MAGAAGSRFTRMNVRAASEMMAAEKAHWRWGGIRLFRASHSAANLNFGHCPGHFIALRHIIFQKTLSYDLTLKPSACAKAFCRASNVINSTASSFLAVATCKTSRLRQPTFGLWIAAHCAAARKTGNQLMG